MLRGRGDPAVAEARCEAVDAEVDHLAGLAAEAAALVGDRRAGPGEIEDRREVDVDAVVAEEGCGRAALLGGEVGSAAGHPLGRGDRRPDDPADLAALLVDHDEQRVVDRRLRRRLLQRVGHLPRRALVADVVGEQDHPGELARSHHLQQLLRRLGAVEAGDQALAGDLLQRERRERARLGDRSAFVVAGAAGDRPRTAARAITTTATAASMIPRLRSIACEVIGRSGLGGELGVAVGRHVGCEPRAAAPVRLREQHLHVADPRARGSPPR